MTIRRQYSLPNCTLVLDGLSDGSVSGITDSRPVMSSLFNAECHFVGRDRPLYGGRDFLTSLVSTVSNYAQEFLSGISHPKPPAPTTDNLVSLARGERENTHCLQAKLDPANNPDTDGQPTQVELSTVQLFDLLEAIDQFLADRRTLPDIMVPLRPVTKAVAQPISAQATPIGLGMASLIVAGLVGYALPSPQVSKPQFTPSTPVVAPSPTKPVGTPPTPAGSPNSAPSPTSAQPTPTVAPTPAAPSPATAQPTPSVAPTPAAPSPTSAQPTPSVAPSAAAPSPATAQLTAAVAPTTAAPALTTASAAKSGQIVDATQLGFLERKLRRDLNNNWQNRAGIERAIAVNVGVDGNGRVVSYEPVGQIVDKSTLQSTPLAKIATRKPAAGSVGKFSVVFNPTGTLDIKPESSATGTMTLGKSIDDPKLTTKLGQQLQTQLQQSSITRRAGLTQDLKYRVALDRNGEIGDYEPQDAIAAANESKTPLPRSVKFNPQAATSQAPLAQYDVVFLPNGKVRVKPK
jgi:outer membrane biosynthesis protein TonB